ncbi:MAG: site-specific DNA-methyltransferase [Chloroflexi bacterium]|nr:site-specific DNA-methyltransferase [Chloroflexota bacterium]
MMSDRPTVDQPGASPTPPWSASPEEVAQFVARYGRRYDPENHDYTDPGPFAEPVAAGKNSPVYNAHSYHTKVPPEGIRRYLEHYTHPGDLVLDPFCGSGMTGVACVMTGRYAILNDLSPAATHIAYNYCNPVDPQALRAEWDRVRDAVREEFDWLYGTTCDRCGGPAAIQHTVWSDVFRCRGCQGEILLWDAAVVRELTARGYNPPLSGGARPGDWKPPTPETSPPKPGDNGQPAPRTRGDVLDNFACPHCGISSRKTQLRLVRTEPVLTEYECPRCRPKRQQHPASDDEKKRIAEINAAPVPYWYPTLSVDKRSEMYIRSALQRVGIERACDFWTRRNLWALARLWAEGGSPLPLGIRMRSDSFSPRSR